MFYNRDLCVCPGSNCIVHFAHIKPDHDRLGRGHWEKARHKNEHGDKFCHFPTKITLLNVNRTAILTHGLVLPWLWLRSCAHKAQGLVPTPGGFSQASGGPGVWRASCTQRKVELAGESQLTGILSLEQAPHWLWWWPLSPLCKPGSATCA